MDTTLKITTRQLLREFKEIKSMLVSHQIQEVIVPISGSQSIKIELEEKEDNRQAILEAVNAITTPIKIKRDPNFSDDLLRS